MDRDALDRPGLRVGLRPGPELLADRLDGQDGCRRAAHSAILIGAGGVLASPGSMPKRIIPVSSGKGGVGKTTVATNFALSLSRYAPTLLVDLDTGTSSVRNTIGVPVEPRPLPLLPQGVPARRVHHPAPRLVGPRRPLLGLRVRRGAAPPDRGRHELRPREEGAPLGGDQRAPGRLRRPRHEGGPRLERRRLPSLVELRDPRLHPPPAVGDARRVGHRQGDPLPQAPDRLLPLEPLLRPGEGPADDDPPRQRPPRRGGGRLRAGPPEPRRLPRRPRLGSRPAPGPRAGGPNGRALPGPLRPERLQRRRRGVRHGGEALRREPRDARSPSG